MFDLNTVSQQITVLKTSPNAGNMPKQIPTILAELHNAILDLQQRVAKLEGNILGDPDILNNPNVLK
jgi:hypothetical protein